jgi:hypothetical protein
LLHEATNAPAAPATPGPRTDPSHTEGVTAESASTLRHANAPKADPSPLNEGQTKPQAVSDTNSGPNESVVVGLPSDPGKREVTPAQIALPKPASVEPTSPIVSRSESPMVPGMGEGPKPAALNPALAPDSGPASPTPTTTVTPNEPAQPDLLRSQAYVTQAGEGFLGQSKLLLVLLLLTTGGSGCCFLLYLRTRRRPKSQPQLIPPEFFGRPPERETLPTPKPEPELTEPTSAPSNAASEKPRGAAPPPPPPD